MDENRLTPAEHAADIAAAEANLPVPMRRPDGQTRVVSPAHVQARLEADWILNPRP